MSGLAIPQRYEDALWRATRRELGDDAVESTALRRAIVARSRRYTSERERLDEDLIGFPARLDLAARALFFTPADAPKAMLPMMELSRRDAVGRADTLRVLDVGAGVGAMTLGVAACVGEDRLRVTAIDRDSSAQRVFGSCARELGIAVEATDADAVGKNFGEGLFDLAIAGGVLNELPDGGALDVVTAMLRAIDLSGAVIVVEPALRETSRRLHRIRDAVLSAGLGHVFAPCTRGAAPCPALEDESDWCHDERVVSLTKRTRQLAQATGLRDGGLKFSYLVLRREPLAQVEVPTDCDALRVVSQPRKTKGKIECFACGEAGRDKIRLLSRARGPGNRGFGKARRGDVLIVPRGVTSDIPKGARVEVRSVRSAADRTDD